MFNDGLSFGPNGAKAALVLSRRMPNLGESGAERIKILTCVIQTKVLYAAPIWAGTTSRSAVQVVAGIQPIALLALERQVYYELKEYPVLKQ